MGVHLHDVLVAGDRPVSADFGHLAVAVVHRVFGAQPIEDVALDAIDEMLRIGRVQPGQRHRRDPLYDGGFGSGFRSGFRGSFGGDFGD